MDLCQLEGYSESFMKVQLRIEVEANYASGMLIETELQASVFAHNCN